MQGRIGIIYTDSLSQTHFHSFGIKNLQWGQFQTQNSSADATLWTAWTNVLKALVGSGTSLQSWRLLNSQGAVVKEYIPGAAVVGTHTVVAGSQSFTVGIGYSAPAQGLTGRGYHATSHMKLGHSDFSLAGSKTRLNSAQTEINSYVTWLAANIPVAVGNDIAATYKNYFTLQYNTYYQRRYGS